MVSPARRLVLGLCVIAALGLAGCGSTVFPTPLPTPQGGSTPSAGTPAATPTGLAAEGRLLFATYGCAECHGLSGERLVGPPLNGLFGSKQQLSDGRIVTADEAYLKLSILEPDAEIVNGYPSGVMSGHIQQFESDIGQSNHLDALVAFIQSQK
jgi:cytochrome c oxidase subunit 2